MVYSQQHRSISILMLPWLAHGHISPFLELAKKLTHKRNNLHFYICSTPVNLTSIKPKLSEKYSHCIEFVELHLSHDEFPELPPHYHTTNGLPPHLMSTLKKAFDMSSSNFSNILQTLKPDLLIYDFLQPWAPSLALSHNIPSVEFCTMNAATIISTFVIHFNNSGLKFPFPGIHLRDYEIRMFKNQMEFLSNGLKDGDRIQQCCSSSCNIILAKTSREIEAKYIDYLSDLVGKKIVPVGPLVQDPLGQKTDEESPIIQWLNKREKSSVVYVSFGSEYFLSKEDIEEIAHGLELSKVSFIWVIRFPKEDKTTKVEEVLPKWFVERGWAPQAKILQNPSVGGFVSHCGWSSVLESIKFGVPIIAMPMQLDQPVNAKLVEEVGVGVEAKRAEGGSLQREVIAEAIGKVVVKKIGEGVRRKALEVRDNMKKIEDEEMDDVVEQLMQLRT
ncbi:flavanone 7-O-glucoside 2''-O-beta-L-rhamnosyltransferase-like [Pyrus ussuriensis x Pyrus communis]|uniref:Glycosyltransferase n=1 Tax=Pyrus ussuriensis x Pyrus communis TaxID=2448454 RepID=A0A5N5HLK7_9ROSA|nr:flavanone 7-O-glucoside 2''-O-beta-L-rhamnosyltransferase-like [Pyrus ussuriensis x Pyrus communis]